MKHKLLMAISASVVLVGANLFVVSAKQGNVNCKELLVKAFTLNHFAYADDPGEIPGSIKSRGVDYSNEIADCSIMETEAISVDVSISSTAGQKLAKYINGSGSGGYNGGPISASLSISGGADSNNSSNNQNGGRIKGTIYINVKTAKPEYVYCDRSNYNDCWSIPDPCNTMKMLLRRDIRKEFGI